MTPGPVGATLVVVPGSAATGALPPRDGRTLRGFPRVGELLVLLCLTALLSGCAFGRSTPRSTTFPVDTESGLPQGVSVRLALFQGEFRVECSANGSAERSWQIDTGAQFCVLPRELVELWGLETRSRPGWLTGATHTTWGAYDVVTLQTLRLGDVVFHGVDALVIDDRLFNVPLIGFGLFDAGVLVLDGPAGVLELHPRETASPLKDDGHRVRYSLERHRPLIETTIGEHSLRLCVDSGLDAGISLPDEEAEALPLVAAPVITGRSKTINARSEIRHARCTETLRLAGHAIEMPMLAFGTNEGLIGYEVLRHFRLTFDPRTRSVHFARASDEPLRSEPVRGFGFAWERSNTPAARAPRYRITQVVPGSPAERAGLQIGDIVVGTSSSGSVGDSSPRRLTLTIHRDRVPHVIDLRDGVVVP